MSVQTSEELKWIPRPLNRVGDLGAWKAKMKSICSCPKLGEVVSYQRNDAQRIKYKVIGFKTNGDPIWQRGQAVNH